MSSALIAVFLVLIAVALYFAVTRVDRYLKIKAIDDCEKTSRYQTVDKQNGATTWFPVTDVYKNCLKTKGY